MRTYYVNSYILFFNIKNREENKSKYNLSTYAIPNFFLIYRIWYDQFIFVHVGTSGNVTTDPVLVS